MINNVFAQALKNKYRFSFRGVLSTEDLFGLTIKDLNEIYKHLKKQEKENDVEGLIDAGQSMKNIELKNKLDIIKLIYNDKLAEQAAHVSAVQKAENKRKILEAIENKKNDKFSEMTLEQLEDIYNKL